MITYVPNGRDITKGVDCYGLVKYYYEKEHGVKIVDFDYKDPNDPSNEHYFIESMNSPKWVKVEKQKGAVVALRVNGHISHCGYMVSDNEFIHIMKDCGVARVRCDSPKWKNRIVGFYKYA